MDKLFLLHPGFSDNERLPAGQTFYCPYSAFIEGVLAYYPDLRNKIEIHYVDFQRPRKEIIELLGEENQGCPLLIADESCHCMEMISFKSYGSYQFINDANQIAQYFSCKFQLSFPHF
jgi:Protein of unknown function (DUF3088)